MVEQSREPFLLPFLWSERPRREKSNKAVDPPRNRGLVNDAGSTGDATLV
jgi:hypothetical protein